jgi:RHS repeat-associated protein
MGAGRIELPGAGLTKLGARYYDAGSGGFLSVDPVVGDAGEPRRRVGYVYAFANPARFVDMDGRSVAGDAWDFAKHLADVPAGGIQDWAVRTVNDSGAGPLAKGAATLLGTLSSLGTCENFSETAMALLPGPGRFKGLGRGGEIAYDGVKGGREVAYHYTRQELIDLIMRRGLRKGSYVTRDGKLSPTQAQIDLALPPNRGVPSAVIRVDLAGLRRAGYDVGDFVRAGRKYNMPGGGSEMQLDLTRSIPPKYLTVVR